MDLLKNIAIVGAYIGMGTFYFLRIKGLDDERILRELELRHLKDEYGLEVI